jgi:hypothetical protein
MAVSNPLKENFSEAVFMKTNYLLEIFSDQLIEETPEKGKVGY